MYLASKHPHLTTLFCEVSDLPIHARDQKGKAIGRIATVFSFSIWVSIVKQTRLLIIALIVVVITILLVSPPPSSLLRLSTAFRLLLPVGRSISHAQRPSNALL
jgi:hypothetical protein